MTKGNMVDSEILRPDIRTKPLAKEEEFVEEVRDARPRVRRCGQGSTMLAKGRATPVEVLHNPEFEIERSQDVELKGERVSVCLADGRGSGVVLAGVARVAWTA
ncbi:hypothetical protein NL676_011780 [Syzygium grande]|nr:hypothetical protein NL676_011780 [Syzygium grande]